MSSSAPEMTLTSGKEFNLELMELMCSLLRSSMQQLDACLRYEPVSALPTFCQLLKKVGGRGVMM